MVHIILPVHNRIELTRAFVESLVQSSSKDFHIVLVDDGSTDGTSEMVCESFPFTTVIRGTGNWWWGGSLHQGYLWARSAELPTSDVIMTVNDDTALDPAFLENAERLLKERPRDLLVATARDGRDILQEQRMKVDWLRLRFRPIRDGETPDWCTTRGLCMRVSEFLSIGGFYPTLLPHYLSDVEYTLRARRKGHPIFSDPSVSLRMNTESTGHHLLKSMRFWPYVKTVFSRKTSHNPIYMTTFLFLAAPFWAIPTGLLKVWALPLVEFFGFRREGEIA
ncbi:MAG TPA: glycosyltransferase family 2 protein [Leptospiraceae bacterium]|nr:glycosyltransferase family 2 protein [Leptospirales bacterium]HMU84014.1 glycosyltransferase family 2 protein [Leptospiraceae bacterium]HMW58466.1 glycosyltransferase family 2 protein [Leptospiraceae bacterium]HMX56276.1 glycosyltransferase family 2 protein [Leptospiraceae bacterium]HMY45618.1 glycosyltransferase family 2 protein [Leptospiraceae bacterium]